jgi:hypothetical protein
MHLLRTVMTLFCLAAPAAAAALGDPADGARAGICRDAALLAEKRHNIPAGLLAAIAVVESGRTLPDGAEKTAWPWTINAEGTGHWFETREEAMAKVERLKSEGVRSIDIGCMQVNQKYHPDAFGDLRQAFTPIVNADYAARFLKELFEETRSWSRAVSFYHSRTPERALRYRKLVMDAWNTERVHALDAGRADVLARTGRNRAAASGLRIRRGSTVYFRSGGNTVRVRRY